MQLSFELEDGYRETPEETFWRVYRQMRLKVRRSPAEVRSVRLRWRPYANSISTLRLRDGEMHIGLSEALRHAPDGVLEALAEILISKIFRHRPAPEFQSRYRVWLNSPPVRADLERLRQSNGRKHTSGSAGNHYDLQQLFDDINTRYFHGAIPPVSLAWSRSASRTHLGHWDPAHQTIVLSRFLDRPDAPRLAVEYVMFHEMLHVLHPTEFENGRRKVHHRRFRDAEKAFEGLTDAKAQLKRLCSATLSF
ncbi:MAG TPA: M48 family peptidase [Bryobacteraceae bacterium]|nr:M48 family peptidase [Bryobacteraceae bacterium]